MEDKGLTRTMGDKSLTNGSSGENPQSKHSPSAVVPTLGLFGVTINSMALIAPGAFLWTTFFLQMVCADSKGNSFAPDVFVGIIFAIWVAFMTAFPFAELAHVYPEAGAGGPCYFAERAFKHCKIRFLRKWTHFMKWYMGWSIHLFYWVYPGVTTALMAQTIQYLINTAPSRAGQDPINAGAVCGIAIACAAIVALVAVRGINFSTTFNIGVVIMQSASILMYGVLWSCFRQINPLSLTSDQWQFPVAADIWKVHSGLGMLYQSSIAILILVGFDSATQLGAETKKPERNVAIGCVLSLACQALISYPIEYVSASAAMPRCLANCDANSLPQVTPMTSASPIGDLTLLVGDAFSLNGYGLMVLLAITVLLSIFGTTLAASNSAIRVTMFLAAEGQFPAFFCKLHPKYRTPWVGILISFLINATLGMAGSASVTTVINDVTGAAGFPNTTAITAITMASNIGTFFLYAGICFTCMVQFWKKPQFNWWRHFVVPFIGLWLNLMEICVIYVVAILNKDLAYPYNQTATAAYIAFGIMGGWILVYCIITWLGCKGVWTKKQKDGDLVTQAEDWSIRTKVLTGMPSAFPGREGADPASEWSVRPLPTTNSELRYRNTAAGANGTASVDVNGVNLVTVVA